MFFPLTLKTEPTSSEFSEFLKSYGAPRMIANVPEITKATAMIEFSLAFSPSIPLAMI